MNEKLLLIANCVRIFTNVQKPDGRGLKAAKTPHPNIGARYFAIR